MNILVIEDEKKIAAFIKQGLKEEGYVVSVVTDGEQGYNAVRTNKFDLIILDLMLPKIDGLTLCKKLRQENFFTPIIMLTAKDAVKDKVAGLDAGANDYLAKPFAFEELLARIRAILRKTDVRQETVLTIGDLSMDLLSHKVSRAGKEIVLTTKEFSLLEYLMRNAGTIVTRTMISEHVWDINFDTDTNVIDVYINYLRRKVDQGFETRIIHTIRGRGYTLKI
ncbi:MAG: response regulator transcription factor [Candidatus Margulisbacteria bacterium]|nr:response regulator transcription factor [Candidatus Margulisiibacteriota bacterium]